MACWIMNTSIRKAVMDARYHENVAFTKLISVANGYKICQIHRNNHKLGARKSSFYKLITFLFFWADGEKIDGL